MTFFVVSVLVVSIGFVLSRYAIAREESTSKRFRLRSRMGSPKWDLSESWASNLTGVGAILGTVVAASDLLPKQKVLFEATVYTGLSLFFAAVAVVAPFVFVALQTPARPHTKTGQRGYELQGYVGTFLVACCLMIWATLGQLLTVLLLTIEIGSTQALSGGLVVAFRALVAGAALLVLAYFWVRIDTTIRDQADLERHRKATRLELNALVEPVPEPDEIVPRLPNWNVL